MTKQQTIARRALAGSVVGALALAACSPNDGPLAARPQLLTSRLALSAGNVAVGGKVAVDVRIDGASEAIGGLQGAVRFDAAKLRYVGQQQQTGTILYVNSTQAARGELRIAEIDPDGIGARKAALVFEVVNPQYVGSIRYENEIATTSRTLAQFKHVENGGVLLDEELSVASSAHMMDYAAWKVEVARQDAARATAKKGPVALRPGEYLLNLKYGDATLDGIVNLTDALYDINVAVGLSEIITGTDAPARDAVVAGNVAPYNVGSPTLLPGDEGNGDRVVNVTDALGIINQVVLGNQAVVGTLIPGRGPVATNVVQVATDITTNTLWTKNNVYNLKTRVNVTNGATLTIEAGTRIEGDGAACTPGTGTGGNCGNTSGTALMIQRDGRIIAQGTPLEPIIMTCSAAVKSKGCWGGFWIAGNAPINSYGATTPPPAGQPTSPAIAGRAVAGCLQATGEAGAPLYGGCNPDDSSGVVQYVRIEYGGLVTSAANVELNNVTLGGVGRGTVMDHLQVFGGSDDGIELFGGTVDLKYLVIQANGDDQFDYAEGWIGRAQFVITQEDPADGDKGFEVDNSPNTAQFPTTTNTPWGTNAEVWNATILGRIPGDPTGSGSMAGLHLRRGYKGSVRNVLMYGFPHFLYLDDVATCATDVNGTGRDSLVVRNGYFVNATTAAVKSNIAVGTLCQGADPLQFLADAGTSAGTNTLDLTAGSDPFYPSSAGRLNQAMERTNPDYRPRNGMSTALAANPVSRRLTFSVNAGGTSLGTVSPLTRAEFFDNSAKYFGAVPPASASKSDIPWYSGWTRTSNFP